MILFAIIFALLLNFVKNKTNYGADTIISVFSSIAIALGLAILAQSGNFSKYSSYLVGDILSITNKEIVYLLLAFITVGVFWYLTFNKLMISIRWIGILLINSLLILPAASSRNIAKNMRLYHLYAIIFSLFSGILGLIISYYWNIPTGPIIVLVSGIIYFITFGLKKIVKQ